MTTTREQQLSLVFRVALAMCFIGHGMFGVLTKEEWIPFFGLVGLSPDSAFTLMPLIGGLDMALGVFVLFRPVPAAILYMASWALWTAALRPLTGQSLFEMLERAGNYGLPIAFLLFLGIPRCWRAWFSTADAVELSAEREGIVRWTLLLTTALLLLGHGGLALSEKPVLVGHVTLMGFGAAALPIVGLLELALAATVLLAPRPWVLAGVAAWKIGTEMLYPLSGAPIWEFVERGGSYAAPLLVALMMRQRVARPLSRVASRIAPAAMLAALTLVLPETLAAQQRDSVPVAPAGILDSLRAGGYVIACRHAATHHDQSDHGPAREQQRNLSPSGEEQARNIGAVIRALGIPIGEVRSNPMYRNRETAEYAFGEPVADSSLTSGRGLRRFLVAPVSDGTNRAIVVRQGTIYDAFREQGVRRTSEGDCFIVRPVNGDNFTVLARLRAEHWGVARPPSS